MSVDAQDGAADAAASIEVPQEREIGHHDPDEFEVRCTDCGTIGRYEARGDAESHRNTHGLNCSQTAVRPVAAVDPREPEDGDEAELTYVSRQTGNRIHVTGRVSEFDGDELAIWDPTRSREIAVDLDTEWCESRANGDVRGLGDLHALEVRSPVGPGAPEPPSEGVEDCDGRQPDHSDAERERREAAAEEFEARIAAADGGDDAGGRDE